MTRVASLPTAGLEMSITTASTVPELRLWPGVGLVSSMRSLRYGEPASREVARTVTIEWIPADSPRLSWRGVAEFESVEHGRVPWRLPRDLVPLLSPSLAQVCQVASGVRIAFRTDASEVRIRLHNDELPVPVTLVSGDGFETQELTSASTNVSFGKPSCDQVEVWLPHRGRTVVDAVGVPSGSTVEPQPVVGKRWITYGSSITQSMHATDPAATWPARVARRRDLDLVNLGFASEAHLDPLVAHYMAETTADLITICTGINVYIKASMSVRTYRSSLLEFIRIVRQGHPLVPIVITSPVTSPSREDTPCFPRLLPGPLRRRLGAIERLRNADALFGPTLSAIRAATADVVDLLIDRGDDRLSYVDGRTLLDDANAKLLIDGLHPGPAGEEVIAQRFDASVIPSLLELG